MSNGAASNSHPNSARQPSPATRFDTSTVDRSARIGPADIHNRGVQQEQAWAVERKNAGAKFVSRST